MCCRPKAQGSTRRQGTVTICVAIREGHTLLDNPRKDKHCYSNQISRGTEEISSVATIPQNKISEPILNSRPDSIFSAITTAPFLRIHSEAVGFQIVI